MEKNVKKPDIVIEYKDHILFIEFKLNKEKEKEMRELSLITSGAILAK